MSSAAKYGTTNKPRGTSTAKSAQQQSKITSQSTITAPSAPPAPSSEATASSGTFYQTVKSAANTFASSANTIIQAPIKAIFGESELNEDSEKSLVECIDSAFTDFANSDAADKASVTTFLQQLHSIFETLESEYGKVGGNKNSKLYKKIKSLASSLFEHLQQLSHVDFLLLTIDITSRLAAFRFYLMGSTSDEKEAIKLIDKVMMVAISALEEDCDARNLSLMSSCVERASKELLSLASESLQQYFDNLTPSKTCDLFEDKHWLSFSVRCMILRLCLQREYCLRKGPLDFSIFAESVEKILPNGILFLSRFKATASLHIDDVEYICQAMLFLREFDARRRRIEKVRYLPSANFIRLRDISLPAIEKLFITDPTYAFEKLLIAEIRLLGIFKGLVTIEENYMTSVFRAITKFSNTSTLGTLCSYLKELIDATDKSDLRTPTTLSNTFLKQLFDFVLSPLKTYPIPAHVKMFAIFSKEIPKELKERWLSALFRMMPLHRDTFTYLTNEDVLNMHLKDGAVTIDGGTQRCLEFVCLYLEFKASAIAKAVTMSSAIIVREKMLAISAFAEVVNNFADLYVHFTLDGPMDKLLGFFTPVLKGIAAAPINYSYEINGLLIAEVLRLILLSDRLHSITARLPGGVSDLCTPFRFNESLNQLRSILRKYAPKKEFLEIVREAEKAFAASNTKVPLLYSFVCSAMALTMSQVALSNVKDSTEQVSTTCRFVDEIAMQKEYSMMGRSTSHFFPTLLTLKVIHNAYRSIAVVAESVPYELSPTISSLIKVESNLDKKEFLQACGSHTALATLLSDMVELIRTEFYNIEAAIGTAYSVIDQLFTNQKDRGDSSYRHSLLGCPAKRSTLHSLSQHVEFAKAVSAEFAITTLKNVGTTEISNALKLFDEISKELEDWRSVDSWLRAKGFVPSTQVGGVSDAGQEADLSINEILSKTDVIAARWELSPESARTLKFFVGQRCNLFDTNFSKYFDSHDERVHVQYLEKAQRNEIISNLTNKAIKALENIIRDEELPLSSLAQGDIRGMMRALKGGRNDSILKELNIVAKYFQSLVEQQAVHKKGIKATQTPITFDREELTDRMERLGAAVELLQLSDVLPSAVAFFQTSNSVLNGRGNPAIQDLERLSNVIRDHENIKLGRVRGLLQSVKNGLFGLELYHLQLVGGLNDGHQLFLFLQSEPDIIGQISILTQEMQGNPVHQGILNDLTLVHGFLLRVFPSLISRTEVPSNTLQDLAQRLCAEHGGARAANEMNDALRSCILHVAEITTWFGGALGGVNADKIVANVVRFQREGKYVARTPQYPGGAGLDLVYGEKEFRVTDVRLQEQVKAAVFVCGDDGVVNTNGLSEVQRSALRDFINSHEVASKIVSRLAHAEALGHPRYQACEKSLGESIHLESLCEFLKVVDEECNSWDVSMEDVFESSSRFALLSRKQILQVLLAIGKSKPDVIAVQLRLCFPDANDEFSDQIGDTAYPFNMNFTAEITSMVIEFWSKVPVLRGDGSNTSPIDALRRAGHFVTELEHSFGERHLLSHQGSRSVNGTRPKVLHAIGMDEDLLMRSVEAFMKSLPMSSQLLWCEKGTNKSEIDRLLFAAKNLTSISFAFIGVNELNVDSREYLLNTLTATSASNENFFGDQILLVFTGKNGLDAFSLFDTADSADGQVDTAQSIDKFKTIGAVSSFSNISIVTGAAGSGKTTFIRNQFINDNVDHTMVMTVHEDFSPKAFINWYAEISRLSPNSVKRIGVHVNITPYGRLDRLARFLYAWFAFGLLEDEFSGQVTAILKDVAHYIYIELPALSDTVSKEHVQNHPYIGKLSTVRMLTTSWNFIDMETFPFLIDSPSRLVAYYLDMYWDGRLSVHFSGLPDLPSAVTAEELSNDSCRVLLKRLFSENSGVPEYATNAVQAEIAEIIVLIETVLAEEGPDSQLLPDLYNRRQSLDPSCATVQESHFHRSACVRLLFERVQFFPQLQRKVKNDIQSGYGDMLSTDILENPDCSHGYFAFLMSLFIHESATLSDNSLQQNWSTISTPFTARYASADSTQFYILCMSAESEAEKNLKSRNSYCGVSGAALRASPGILRSHFAPAFGINRTERLLIILKSQSYVLTPDFAVKMQVLFEKRRTKSPTILRGETGTGKTELLNMLSLLSNADIRLVPDMALELRNVLQKLVESGLLTHHEASHRVIFMKLDDETPKTRRITIPAKDGSPAVTKEVGELWGSEDPQKLLNGILQILEEENDELVAQLAPIFVQHFRRILHKHPLLKRTDWVKSVLHRDLLNRIRIAVTEGRIIRDGDDQENDEEEEEEEEDISEEELQSPADIQEDDTDPCRSQEAISNARGLIDFIRDVVTACPKNLFHCIRMHEGIKADEFRELVLAIKKEADDANQMSLQLGIPIELVAFIDELNTTSIMGMVKEVFMDHMLDGVPLPDNIFWVAAINPSNKVADPTIAPSPRGGASNFTGVKSDSQDLRYIVNDMPKSLELVVMEYSSFTTDQERDWIENYLSDTNLGLATELQNDENKNYIISALRVGIIASQEFVRNARMERVEVSIRDMVRAVELYRFLLLPENRETFLPAVQGEENREIHMIDRERCWKALIVSLALVYFFRLDTSRDLRSKYMVMLMKLFEHDGLEGRGCVDAHRELSLLLPFEFVLTQSIDKLWNCTKRPRGIAPTRGLKENLFATVICIEACIPLIITGPPGTGKTLSFQIASRNMKGISSPTASYKKLKLVQPFTYQCSQQSTASEIKDVFEAALARRQRFLRAGITSERCVVFMDEAGLPSERRAALKSIHYYTDHAQVASVMITNQTLDTAKTNRAVQLLQSETTRDDLKALALGSLFDYDITDDTISANHETDMSQTVEKQVIGLCEAYSEAKCFCDIPGHPDAYHLRDFIYLCRFIRHIESQSVSRMSPRTGQFSLFSAATLLYALRRTFNGISDTNFRGLASMFIAKTNLLEDAIASFGSTTTAQREDPGEDLHLLLGSDVMSSLRDALRDQLKPDEDPNQSHFRHIMLIDNSSSENAIALLFDLNVLDKQITEVFEVSDFPDDMSDLQRSALISRIKTAVETGKTILLVNSQSIITAFFDLVNKHYMPVGTRSKVLSPSGLTSPDNTENEEVTQDVYYANISMGSFSRPCVVHPKTKIIVHIPVAQMPFTPLPFLNRFDKFRISVIDALNETLEELVQLEAKHTQNIAADYYPLSKLYCHIHDGVEDFVHKFNGKTMMYGLVERETVAALILRSIKDTVAVNNFSFPVIRRSFHVDIRARQENNRSFFDEDEEDGAEINQYREGDNDEQYQDRLLRTVSVLKNIRRFVRDTNLQLLQYARPEHVFLAREVIPVAYIREYLRQEHFSASNLIRFLVNKHWNRPLSLEALNIGDANGHKFIIFMRTSAELYRLRQSADLQRQLLPPSDLASSFIRVIHLGSYTSATKCMNDIGRFVEIESQSLGSLHRRLLLVVADRTIVSTSQVNITIRKIDQLLSMYQSKELLPLVIILQHFPSESLQFGASYDSLPFNGWDMQYCDSFQLEEVIDDTDTVVKREMIYGAIESKEPEPVHNSQETNEPKNGKLTHNFNDARRWMQVAFGLEKVPNPSDAVAEFQHAFFRELQVSLSSTSGPREDAIRWKALQARGIEKSLPLYANKPDKVATVLKVFRERSFLTDALLRLFTSAWSSELAVTVQDAAEELITGRSLESMLDKIRGSFQILLRAFCRYSILTVASNYGFEAISNLPTDGQLGRVSEEGGDSDAKIRATCSVLLLEGLKMPAADELRRLGTASSTILGSEFKYPPRIPMFNELMNQIRKVRAVAVTQIAGDEDCSDDILTRMRDTLPRYKSLNRTIEYIMQSSSLWEDIIHDKICCSCGIDRITDNELAIITAFINVSLENKRDVIRLLVDNSAMSLAIQIVNILQPIRRLSSGSNSQRDFPLLLWDDMSILSLDQMLCELQTKVVIHLWQRGSEVFTSDVNCSAVRELSAMQAWVSAVRELSCKAKSFYLTADSNEFGYSGAVCLSVFRFLLQALSTGCSVQAIRDRSAELFLLDISSPQIVTSLFPQLLSIIEELTSGINNSENSTALAGQTEELVSWFAGPSFTAVSISDVKVVLAGLGSDSVNINALKSIAVLVQIRWLLNMLDSPVDGLLSCVNDELHSRGVLPEVFAPQNISSAVSYFWSQRGGLHLDEAPRRPALDCTLRVLVFQALLEQYRASPISFNLNELLRIFENDLLPRFHEVPLYALKISSLAVHIAEVAAVQWAEGGNCQVVIESLSDRLLSVFELMDGLKEYFFLSLRSESAMTRFFSSRDRLQKFNLDDSWYVHVANGEDSSIDRNQIYGWLPFMVIQEHDLYEAYNALAIIVRSESAEAHDRLYTWAHEQVLINRKFIARMMIFVASFHECFMQSKPCQCVSQFLRIPRSLALLDITSVEAKAYMCVASGPCAEALTADDGIRYIFSVDSMRDKEAWMTSRRSCAVNAMALILGSSPEKSYYYTVCFDNRVMQSHGLGSGYGLYSKDCGYQVELDTFRDIGTQKVVAFRNIRRYRALNNYLVWIAYAWGHWVRDDKTSCEWAVTYRERFNTHGLQDRFAVQEQQRMQQLSQWQQTAINMVSRGKMLYTYPLNKLF